MTENRSVPPLHRNPENEHSEHTQIGFNTLSGASSVVGGASRGYMSSHRNTNPINNNRRFVLAPAPTRPSSGEEDSILPHELNNDMALPSSKRPRGRPPGSKNRPKKPIVVTKESDSLLIPINLLVPAGNDIVKSVIKFAQRRNSHITVLKGSGPVSNVTLLNPNSRAPDFPIQGTYNMTSLSGTWVNPSCGNVPPQLIANPSCSSFVIYLSSSLGQIFGGTVGGMVKAASDIIVFATLTNMNFLPGMALGDRNIRNVEEDGRRYVADQSAVEQHNINNSVVSVNSALLSRQPLPTADVNLMQWNHSNLANNY